MVHCRANHGTCRLVRDRQKLQREDAYFNRSAAELRAEKHSWKKRTKNGRAQAKMKNKGWGD